MKIVYCDLDDTLCDFTTEYQRRKLEKPEMRWPHAEYGFFTSLEPMYGAIGSMKLLAEKYDVWILTKPSVHNPLCYTEKRVWVEQHLGFDWCKKLILSPNKALLKGDYLIDDIVHEGFEGEHIHFGTEKFPNWESVLNYLL